MNRNLPALQEALDDWRDLALDRDAADALLHFDEVEQRHATLQSHLDKLRTDPPRFDATDLAAVLERLWSAQRVRNQIAEGNDLDVLVPTLRAFLFDEEESLEAKFADYPARVRYAGHAILGEEFCALYKAIKRDEVETFLQVISPWERDHLLLNV